MIRKLKDNYDSHDQCPKCLRHNLNWKKRILTNERKNKEFHFCKWISCGTTRCGFVWFTNKFKVMKGEKCNCKKQISIVSI